MGASVACDIQDMLAFVVAPISNTISNNPGDVYWIGNLYGLKIYCDPTKEWSDRTKLFVKDDDNSLKSHMPTISDLIMKNHKKSE